jgi:hypothetical protein
MHASSDASLGTRDDLTAVTVTGEENSVPLDCIRWVSAIYDFEQLSRKDSTENLIAELHETESP